MKILLINNDGAGFADYIDVQDNTSVQDLFAQRIGAGKESNYLIRVNRLPVARDQILQEGDRISITPTKIEGAVVSRAATRSANRRSTKQYLMAVKIEQALRADSTPQQVNLVEVETIQALQRLGRMQSLASSRGLQFAATHVRQQLVNKLRSIRESIDQSLATMVCSAEQKFSASMRDIMHDLSALETEFDDVQFVRRRQSLSVTTPPIELEGVSLGRFQIVLELPNLSRSHPYRVIAKDPQPATSCDSTTHPHVQSETLCEGEGQQAIKQALADGRIYDFFQIIHQILQTYNRHSAYIAIGDWFGVECSDCGSSVSEDDSVACTRCGDRTCDQCCCSCEGCDETFCDGCTSSCEGCHANYCNGCISSCDRCEKPFCEDCLTENQCDDCLEEVQAATEAEASPETELEVHTLCLGETAVFA